VKLTFNPERRQDFLDLIVRYKAQILSYPGCQGVVFLNDQTKTNVFFTYSHWDHHECLEAYRTSDLFLEVWSQVKPWFAEKPEAWSLDGLDI